MTAMPHYAVQDTAPSATARQHLHDALVALYRAQDIPLGGTFNVFLDRAAAALRAAGRPDLAERALRHNGVDDVLAELWGMALSRDAATTGKAP